MRYSFKWSPSQREEIESLSFVGFTIDPDALLPRSQWIAIALMATGKAAAINQGRYGPEDDEEVDLADWASDLTSIADVICDFFKPGDGKL